MARKTSQAYHRSVGEADTRLALFFLVKRPPGGYRNLVFRPSEWIPRSNEVFPRRVSVHMGRSSVCVQAASWSHLWTAKRWMRRSCRKHFHSLLSSLPFGCSFPCHAYMYICAPSPLYIITSRIFCKRPSGIFWVFLNHCAIHRCICLDRGLLWWGFCHAHPLKFQCTQALEKPLFERLCFLCWAVYFAFFPHSSLASLWQLLFCMNYIPRGRKSPNSSSRFDSCLCD